jgi:hypothetical protein
MMKRLGLSCIFLLAVLGLRAQFLENRFELGIGTGVHVPLNRANVKYNGQFSYPSLYGNYKPAFVIHAVADYRLHRLYKFGLQVEQTRFVDWGGNQKFYILEEPELHQSSFAAKLSFLPARTRPGGHSLNLCFFVAPILIHQTLHTRTWSEPSAGTRTVTYPELLAGFRSGVILNYHFNNQLMFRIDAFYQVSGGNSILYLDRLFHSGSLSITILIKLMKDKYFMYA